MSLAVQHYPNDVKPCYMIYETSNGKVIEVVYYDDLEDADVVAHAEALLEELLDK